ncbi:DUF3083 family protein [Shewanella intestini]|uniref:DUF3083 family protein n=1 Tax=Shewanella intestini TaxID=2017544 RepID=A0ABS5I5F3_9GAMM|nr:MULTISPECIES: DUF3083 family protein [Shewanella]MBR9729253.1 DUF3083 family protein [Shewanella intestini]MRG35398.1 DUF3083 family protein [Shewanella sp. XMDDZSB0408]
MSASRQKKVYLPTSARKNQFITVGFPLTDEFVNHYDNIDDCYREFSHLVFKLAEEFELYNVHVVATDKLPVVRYHAESYCFPTQEQLRFFYNPAHHEANRLHMTSGYRAKKLKIVFLSTGTELRNNAASFHAKIQAFNNALKPMLPTQSLAIKVRDHQHISYDFFAKNKGNKESYAYKLRVLNNRYQRRECELPEDVSSLNYVLITLPVGRKLKNQLLDDTATDYNSSYQALCDNFIEAAKSKQLTKLAVIANGKVPLVRNSKFDELNSTDEFQVIGFDPNISEHKPVCHWNHDEVAEVIRFVVVAGKEDVIDEGYGRFMNQVEEAMRKFIKQYTFDKEHVDLTIRFHQHLSYKA